MFTQTVPARRALRHPHRPADVLRPDAGRQPVDHVVAEPQCIGFVLEADDREDGAEHLLLRDTHVVGHIGEDRRLDELTADDAFA